MADEKTLYERLGGYDAISAVADDLLPRLIADTQSGKRPDQASPPSAGIPAMLHYIRP